MAKKVVITEADFRRYVKVQMSGRTNMFDLRMVRILSCLPEDKILAVMDQYNALDKKFPNVCKELS